MAGYVSRPRDVIGGLSTVAVGIGFLTMGTDLEFGTARQMGPGYFPVVLSSVLIILGLALAILAWRRPLEEGSVGSIPWRTLALITLPTIFFGVTLRGLGLPLSLFLTLLAVALASRYASIKSALALASHHHSFLLPDLHCWPGSAATGCRLLDPAEQLVRRRSACGSADRAVELRRVSMHGKVGHTEWNS